MHLAAVAFTVWYSTLEFAQFVVAHTALRAKTVAFKPLYESDASKPRDFHSIPDHIKQILYLDSPDLIVEVASEPIFSIEVSTEAGTGHNAFQRFARLAASVENGVPAFYIYPEACIIERTAGPKKALTWDKINPNIFFALEQVMQIHSIPALLYYFPSDYGTFKSNPAAAPTRVRKGLKHDAAYPACPAATDPEMRSLFAAIDQVLSLVATHGAVGARPKLLRDLLFRERRNWMQAEFSTKAGGLSPQAMSPMTSTHLLPTADLLKHLAPYIKGRYQIGDLLRSREKTLIYSIDAKYRGDPYPGALAAIDYIACRQGQSFEERRHNLVLAFGEFSKDRALGFLLGGAKSTIADFVKEVRASETKNILTRDYASLESREIPRYYMQVRYGSMFSKNKQVRVYAYFADAMLFPDGALWRDG